MPSGRDVAGRLALATALGLAFGAATSLANDLSSPYGLGGDVPDRVRSAARVLSLTLGPVFAWVLLPLPLGWFAAGARPGRTRPGAVLRSTVLAASAGAGGVLAAVVAYYVSDALLTQGFPPDISSDLSALLLWAAIGVPGGALLGGSAGAVRRRSG